MPYRTQSTAEPEKVAFEVCPDKTLVWLTDNVEEVQQEEQTIYEYDELVFALPEDRHETAETIEEAFDAWWLYGCEDHSEPTLEERVTILEEIIMEE